MDAAPWSFQFPALFTMLHAGDDFLASHNEADLAQHEDIFTNTSLYPLIPTLN